MGPVWLRTRVFSHCCTLAPQPCSAVKKQGKLINIMNFL